MCSENQTCKVIAVSNQKGGVGKTTTTINLGASLVRLGQRVLLVDADSQGHLTLGLGFSRKRWSTLKTMLENIIMGTSFKTEEGILKHQEGMDVIPSNKLLAGMDMALNTVENRELVLKEYLESIRDQYDFILIDCMPSLGMLTINAMTAADSVLVPVEPAFFSADGLTELLKVYRNIKQRYNPQIEVEGILFTKDAPRYIRSKRNKKAVREAYGNEVRIFETSIPEVVALSEIASEGISIFAYDAKSKGAESYEQIAREVLEHAQAM